MVSVFPQENKKYLTPKSLDESHVEEIKENGVLKLENIENLQDGKEQIEFSCW